MAYDLAVSDDPRAICFGNGLIIGPTAAGWEVCSQAQCWPLDDHESWRAVALLENSLRDVRAAFVQIGTEDDPPLGPIVRAGLGIRPTGRALLCAGFLRCRFQSVVSCRKPFSQ